MMRTTMSFWLILFLISCSFPRSYDFSLDLLKSFPLLDLLVNHDRRKITHSKTLLSRQEYLKIFFQKINKFEFWSILFIIIYRWAVHVYLLVNVLHNEKHFRIDISTKIYWPKPFCLFLQQKPNLIWYQSGNICFK